MPSPRSPGAYALGTQVRDGSAQARDAASTTTTGTGSASAAPVADPRGPGEDLAQRLGVSQDALRKALDALRAQGTGPGAGGPDRDHGAEDQALADALGVTPARLRSALQKLHDAHEQDELTALAKALGVGVAKLQGAFDALRPQGAPGARPAGAPPAGGPRRHDLRGPDGLAAALAKRLGLDAAKVRQALRSVHPDRRARDRAGLGPIDLGAGLAKELGLDPAKVKAALDKLRSTQQQRWQARRDAFADALAKQLGIDAKKARDALAAGPGPGPGHGPGFGPGRPWPRRAALRPLAARAVKARGAAPAGRRLAGSLQRTALPRRRIRSETARSRSNCSVSCAGELGRGDAQRRLVVELERAVVEVGRADGDQQPSTVSVFACSIVGWYSQSRTPQSRSCR